MEMNVFRTIGYDLGIPLSYRFLRRYARVRAPSLVFWKLFSNLFSLSFQCAKVAMPELTLARFILEFSLMNYDIISLSDSKIASACLFMALRMNKKTGWNKTLEYFSGYKLDEFRSIVPILNAALHAKQREANKTVRSKYGHPIFFEVSKTPLMTDSEIFDHHHIWKQSLLDCIDLIRFEEYRKIFDSKEDFHIDQSNQVWGLSL